ncbi:MAG TPA: ATP-binding protein [Candidatus Limnocylindria bacterium]|nr:ATP-binding protein [Candidatus Limnocylindria bacterium]
MSETIYSSRGSISSTRRGSLAWRVLGFAAAVLVALLSVVWIKERTWSRMEQLKEEFAAIESERFLLGLHARESVVRLNAALLRYQLSGGATERDAFRQVSRELTTRIATTIPRLTTANERKVIEQFKAAYEHYLSETAELIEQPVRGVRRDTASQIQQMITEKSDLLKRRAEELVIAQNAAWTEFLATSRRTLASLQQLLWTSVLVLLAFIALLTALIYRAFVSPLRMQLGQSQAVIERQEKLASLGVLAAGVAHEIRNPLTAIKMRLFSLKKSLPAAALDNEDLAIINSEINRLERIVKDTLQFARPSEPELVDVSVAEMLVDVQRLLSDSLRKRDIQLQVEAPENLPLRIDRQQIEQVLINLIQNAADSIGQQGSVTLRASAGAATLARRSQPVVLIEINDTGKGIPTEVERRIFDPFFSTKESGTGLGLSIAARIVEKHGGLIQYSTQLNRGTNFTIVLPRQPLDESTHSPD